MEIMRHHLLVIFNSMENHGKHGTAFSHNLRQHGKAWVQVENADFSDIADFISPIFINPCFRYSPVVNIENTDVRKSRIFKHLSKTGISKIRDFQTSAFSIFTI